MSFSVCFVCYWFTSPGFSLLYETPGAIAITLSVEPHLKSTNPLATSCRFPDPQILQKLSLSARKWEMLGQKQLILLHETDHQRINIQFAS